MLRIEFNSNFQICNNLQAAGYAIGLVGDAGVRNNAEEGGIFIGMLLILIFSEAIGLYGLIVAILVGNSG